MILNFYFIVMYTSPLLITFSFAVKDMSKVAGPLGTSVHQVPHAAVNHDLISFRQALPIWPKKDEIINLINSNQVVVISGDTGSGKTTQVTCFPDRASGFCLYSQFWTPTNISIL
jgi:hypothetical protein